MRWIKFAHNLFAVINCLLFKVQDFIKWSALYSFASSSTLTQRTTTGIFIADPSPAQLTQWMSQRFRAAFRCTDKRNRSARERREETFLHGENKAQKWILMVYKKFRDHTSKLKLPNKNHTGSNKRVRTYENMLCSPFTLVVWMTKGNTFSRVIADK